MASQHPRSARPLAIVTGSSSGIGMHLAREAAAAGYDLLLAADTPFDETRALLASHDVEARTLEVDLATTEGVDRVYEALDGRTPEVLIANAGHGLGKGFLDEDIDEALDVVHTNVTGTIYLVHRIGRLMRDAGRGRILLTGSIAGFMPGTYQAVYNGTKALLDSFAFALRAELKDSGVTVTCLMPGATETEFFARADMLDTKVGTEKKMSAEEVAKLGFEAMQKGEEDVIAGWNNKLRAAISRLMPSTALAEQHRKMAAPGTAAE